MTLIDEAVVEMVRMNKTPREICKALSLTHDGFHSRLRRIKSKGVNVPVLPRGGQILMNSFGTYCDTVERDPRAASVRHLIDFKRAGHTAAEYLAKHEMRIEADNIRPFTATAYASNGSCCGSPALSCVNS